MTFVEQIFFPNFLQRPPFRLNVIIFVSDVRIFHVSPKTDNAGKFFPHCLILPDRFATLFDERFNAVSLNLIFAVNADKFFNFKFDRQAVSIPTCFTQNFFAFHGVVARKQIFNDARQNVTDMRLTVRSRRAVIKSIILATFAL